MRRLPLVLMLAALPFMASADSPPRAKMEVKYKQYDVKMRDFNFPSGLRIIFQEDHSQPIVSITSVIDRGSTSDPEGLEGIAHLCEHMWFRSKQKDDKGKALPKVWDLQREMGVSVNASTADDWTNYMSVAPVDKIIPLLRLESLRMKSAGEGIENDVLLTEREVVRNELRMRYENAAGAAFGHMMVKLFPANHVYGRAAYAGIGNNDSLNAITMPDVQKFFKDNYGPENTTIVVVGDFKLEDTGKFLDEFALDQLVDPKHPKDEIKLVEPKPRVAKESAEPPPPPAPLLVKGDIAGLTTEHGAVEKPTLVLGWTLPGGYRDTEPMMNMAANQIGLAIASSLYPSGNVPAGSLGCFLQPQKEASVAFCFIEIADEKDAPRLAEKALDGLHEIWTTDEMFRRIQEYRFTYSKTAELAAVFQNVDLVSSIGSGRAAETANFVHYTGDPLYYSRKFEWIKKIEASDARALSEKYLNRSRAAAVLMLPYEDGDLAMDTSDAQYRGARREDVLATMMTEEQLSPGFIEAAVIPPDVSKLKESTLPNGLKVVTMSHSDAPLVEIRLVFQGGIDSVDDATMRFTSAMWQDTNLDPTTGARIPDPLRIVAFDNFAVNGLTTDFEISASAGNLEDALFVLRDRIDNLLPDTNGRFEWSKASKANILTWMKYPEEWSSIIGMERLLPNHPLSRWWDHDDFKTMDSWSAAVPAEMFARVLRPENATLYIVGNAAQDEASKHATTYFGGWTGWGKAPTTPKEMRSSYPAATEPPTRQVVLFNKDNSSQTSVSYMCQLGKVDAENVAAAQIVADALSEDAWQALREQAGASYGAGANTSYYRGGVGILNMASLVQNDAAPFAVKVFLELGEKAKAGKIPTKTLAVVKYNRAQSYVAGHQSTAQMMSRIAGTLGYGWGVDFFKKYPKQLANVTIDQIKPLMDRCVGHEVITAIGPVDVIKPLFEKQGIPFEVFDWKQAKLDYATKHKLKDVLKADEKKKKEEAKKKDEKK